MARPDVTAEAIREAVVMGRWEMGPHARRALGQQRIETRELLEALASCELQEPYPMDTRGPSALVLGFAHGRAIHAVCALSDEGVVFIITTYVPSMPRWRDARTRNPDWQHNLP